MLIKRNSVYEEESSKIAKFLNSIMYDIEDNRYKDKTLTDTMVNDHTGLAQDIFNSDFAYNLRKENISLTKRDSYLVERSLIFNGILGVDLVYFYGHPAMDVTMLDLVTLRPDQKFALSSVYSHSFRNNIRCAPLKKGKAIYWKRKIENIVNHMVTRAREFAEIRNRK